jgi:hypothetical protein
MNNPELELTEEEWLPLLASYEEHKKEVAKMTRDEWFYKAFLQHYEGCEAPQKRLKAFKHKLWFENPEDEKGILYRICKTCEKVTGIDTFTEEEAEALLGRLEKVIEKNLIKKGRQEMKDEIMEAMYGNDIPEWVSKNKAAEIACLEGMIYLQDIIKKVEV